MSDEQVEPGGVGQGVAQPAGWYPTPDGGQRYWDGSAWTDHVAERVPQVVRVTDRTGKGGQATVAWVVAVCTLGYMLPWAIAATRGKANSGAIGWLNLLVGWTVIGWIAALVMACMSHQSTAVVR